MEAAAELVVDAAAAILSSVRFDHARALSRLLVRRDGVRAKSPAVIGCGNFGARAKTAVFVASKDWRDLARHRLIEQRVGADVPLPAAVGRSGRVSTRPTCSACLLDRRAASRQASATARSTWSKPGMPIARFGGQYVPP